MKHRLHERLINNGFYFVFKTFRGSWVLAWFAVMVFGFSNVLYFSYGVGITASVLWEIKCHRERRMIKAAVLYYFGVPKNVEFPEVE